jgi:hypothetical protein
MITGICEMMVFSINWNCVFIEAVLAADYQI